MRLLARTAVGSAVLTTCLLCGPAASAAGTHGLPYGRPVAPGSGGMSSFRQGVVVPTLLDSGTEGDPLDVTSLLGGSARDVLDTQQGIGVRSQLMTRRVQRTSPRRAARSRWTFYDFVAGLLLVAVLAAGWRALQPEEGEPDDVPPPPSTGYQSFSAARPSRPVR